MWKYCPQHILWGELKILKPSHILVLGKDTMQSVLYVFKNCLGYSTTHIGRGEKKDEIKRYVCTRANSKIGIVGVPHPGHARFNANEFKVISDRLKSVRLP
jgi:uracil-DNA glycosylase